MSHLSCIAAVHGREVLDSRGRPTVEVEVRCTGGACGTAIVPSGASTGRFEAHELRDGDPKRYDGLGVLAAVRNVNEDLGPAVTGMPAEDQAAVDARLMELDGTPQKSRLGANALLGVSLATAHAAAAAQGLPLYRHFAALAQAAPRMPLPIVNMISGGLHAGGNLDFQDVLASPAGAASYREGLEWMVRVYRRSGTLLTERGYEGRLVGDEGGFGPRLASNRQALELVTAAIELAGLRPGADVTLSLDVASTHFWDGTHYRLAATGGRRLDSGQMIDLLAELVDSFPVTRIEDGLAEEDWSGWAELTRRLGARVKLVGDDLFTTSAARLSRGIDGGVANSVLVKFNQIGTLTETLATLRLAAQAGYERIVSARSGETEDATLADLAVGAAAEIIKIGSIVRSERLAKYNRLLRIEEELCGAPK